ncbi:hypothetical protein [uncultured Bacteroides sp.]|uniref:hypothetical protein n=1 Tax=uncultured Bacteroides sp. TaxID=162156 RepID=UPI00262E83DC|nr:hypothetical protein [uncultured Bacteroides sp.]
MYFEEESFSGKSVGEWLCHKKNGWQRAGTFTAPIANRNLSIYSSFGFTELKIGEAKLAGVKGLKRSYRPSLTGLGVKSQ